MVEASSLPPNVVVDLDSVAGVGDCVHRVACVHVTVVVLIICLKGEFGDHLERILVFTCWLLVRLFIKVGLFSFVSFMEIVVFGSASLTVIDPRNLKKE